MSEECNGELLKEWQSTSAMIEIGDKLGMSIFIVVSWSNHRARMWVCQALEEAVVAEGPDSWVSTMLGTVLQSAGKKVEIGGRSNRPTASNIAARCGRG